MGDGADEQDEEEEGDVGRWDDVVFGCGSVVEWSGRAAMGRWWSVGVSVESVHGFMDDVHGSEPEVRWWWYGWGAGDVCFGWFVVWLCGFVVASVWGGWFVFGGGG